MQYDVDDLKSESWPGRMTLQKIVSGGQTGVDRAALDVAHELGLETGGWCPQARLAEDGPIDLRYPLKETPSALYQERTLLNVRDSEATLILHRGEVKGGTALTLQSAKKLSRPRRTVDLTQPADPQEISDWIAGHQIGVLNVAGPRESEEPGIYPMARTFLRQVLTHARRK